MAKEYQIELERLIFQANDEEDECDDDVCAYRFNGCGRLILETKHGTIFIDIRRNDVNAYTLEHGRMDHLLISKKYERLGN